MPEKTEGIPQSLTQITQEGQIPPKVAEQPTEEDVEVKPYIISFEYYNKKLCQIQNLAKGVSRKALKNLKIIGTCASEDDFKQEGVQVKPIKYDGEYKKLYNLLPDGVDLYENILPGSARMFYFLLSRVCYLVAFTQSHFETDKVRR